MITSKRFRNIGLVLAAICLLSLGLSLSFRDAYSQQTGSGQPIVSLSAATTGTGTVVSVGNSTQVGWSVIWSAGVSAGQVIVETADSPTYAGTWAPLDTQNFAANAMAVGTRTGPLRFVRARVSTNVVGGTVTVQFNRLIGK